MTVNLVFGSSFVTKLLTVDFSHVKDLLHGLQVVDKSFFVTCNGRRVTEESNLEDGKTYHIIPKLPGGKGGFGSMLRAIGAQIEKTTSREACRDLSGRRMRDINNEKKLKEWLAKEAEREREREQRKQERLAKHLAKPQHKFDDQEYHEQRAKVQEDLEDALSKGLKRPHRKDVHPEASSSKKQKVSAGPSSSKTEWLGMEIDSDDLNSDSDNEADPGDPDPLPEGLSAATSSSSTSPPQLQSPTTSDIKEETLEEADSTADTNTTLDNVSTSHLESELKDAELSAENIKKETVQNGEHLSNGDLKCHHNLLSSLPPPTNGSDEKVDIASSDEPVDLDKFSCSDELENLGLERLKNALMTRGLKCGGTLEERAERLFSIKGLTPDQIDPSLFAKSKGKGKKSK